MDKRIGEFFKKKNNRIIVIILIIGVLLLLWPAKSEPEPKVLEDKPDDEERIAKIISSIKGVGNVEVMVTYSSSEEKRLAYETKSQKADKGDGAFEEDIDREAIIANGEPVVLSKTYPKVKGVVVIAEGVGASGVKEEVLEAVTTAFDISPHKVCILEK